MKNLYILLVFGLVTFLTVQFPHSMISAGELAKGHQKLNNECLSCHKPFGGIANEKCISCHKLSDIGKETMGKQNKTLFHEQLSSQKCSVCHSEHQGAFPENPLRGVKHELLSVAILNNCNTCHNKPTNALHTQISANCNSCHQTQSWKNTISFNHEMLLNKNNCISCHQKPKDNYHSLINENCSKCHSTNKWIPSTFDHSAYFTLDQNHNASCNTCHSTNNFKSFTCFGCHEHSEQKIIAEHNEEGIYNITNCASCHKSGNEHEIKENGKRLNESDTKELKDFIKSNGEKEKENEKDDD